MTVRRPRVRGLDERFESALLPLFARQTPEVNDVVPELYLHGLALGDFESIVATGGEVDRRGWTWTRGYDDGG